MLRCVWERFSANNLIIVAQFSFSFPLSYVDFYNELELVAKLIFMGTLATLAVAVSRRECKRNISIQIIVVSDHFDTFTKFALVAKQKHYKHQWTNEK